MGIMGITGRNAGVTLLDACIKKFRQQAFYNAYWKTFEVVAADTDELRRQVFHLRHQIYCRENRFLEPDQFPDELERDAFDRRAIHHLLIHKETGKPAGTVRVLLPDDSRPLTSFELQKTCDHPLLQIENRVMGLCEISRFCMAQRFRRRPRDGHLLSGYYEQEWDEDGKPGLSILRRRIPYAPLGLMKAAFETAMAGGITNCVMALESSQFQTLRRLGLNYRVLGPRIDMHGVLQPLIFNIKAALDGMEAENRECWEVVSDQGRLHGRASELYHYNWQDTVFDENTRDMILRKLI